MSDVADKEGAKSGSVVPGHRAEGLGGECRRLASGQRLWQVELKGKE